MLVVEPAPLIANEALCAALGRQSYDALRRPLGQNQQSEPSLRHAAPCFTFGGTHREVRVLAGILEITAVSFGIQRHGAVKKHRNTFWFHDGGMPGGLLNIRVVQSLKAFDDDREKPLKLGLVTDRASRGAKHQQRLPRNTVNDDGDALLRATVDLPQIGNDHRRQFLGRLGLFGKVRRTFERLFHLRGLAAPRGARATIHPATLIGAPEINSGTQ
jgi:hypothetical protein